MARCWGQLVLAYALVLCSSSQSAASRGPSSAFILSNSTVAPLLKQLGTSNKEVLYTTFQLDKDRAILYMLRNFVYWVQKAGMLKHALLITHDEVSWRTALGEHMPCFLDRASPTKQDFPEGHRYATRTFDFAKNFWALRFGELGYTSLYLDTDVIVLKDPFKHYQASYDIQGLSDYRAAPSPELPQLGEMLINRCELYRQKRGNELEGGDLVHPAFELQGDELAQSMRALTPCMSLGLWFLRPTKRSLQFLRFVVRWIVDTHQHQWDQAAWNEVLMGFLVGMGDEPPLQLRLLPLANFANIEVWEARKQQHLAVDPVILHAGYLAGYSKAKKMDELGLWKPDDVDHAAAARHLAQLNATLQNPSTQVRPAAGQQAGAQDQGPLPGGAARVALAAAIVVAAPAALLLLAMRRRRPPSKFF